MGRSTILPFTVAGVALALVATHGAALAQGKAAGPVQGIVKLRIVADRYVVLDQHPLVVLKDEKGNITWELPGGSSPWRFDNDAVAIDGSQFLGCRPDAQRLKFTCTNKSPRTAKLYQYRITVYSGKGADEKTIFTDSAVQNE
jgi:hypothetical protein